jgi:hypothetical protein
MYLFQHSQGFIVAFGFDVLSGRPHPRLIAWCDPHSGTWEISPANQAGKLDVAFEVGPEFVRECDGKIIAYQPGKCLEMTYVGPPYVWSMRTLQSEQALQKPVAFSAGHHVGYYHR